MGLLAVAFAAGLAAAGLLTFPVRRLAVRLACVDRPNHRSSHAAVTPRAGGAAIVLAVALTLPWFLPAGREAAVAAAAVAAVAVTSLIDDFRGLSFKTRLAVQFGSALAIVAGLGLPLRAVDLTGVSVGLPHAVGLVLATLFVVAYSNFFNFMDGINGLAAGQAVLTAGTLGALLWGAGSREAAVVAVVVCGASAGFLPHNFPAARIFMGDVGSVTLGFVLAALSLVAHSRWGVPWTFVVLVHAVFLFDAIGTLLKRLARGEPVLPHREHNYQLLVRSGWSHTAATLTLLTITAVCCLGSFLYFRLGVWQWVPLVISAGALAGLTAFANTRALPPKERRA